MSTMQKLAVGKSSVQGAIRVSRLEVRFEVPGIESKKIFANGSMQTRVWVFVEAVDESGTAVELPYFPDLISTRLIRYHDGRPLALEVYTGQPMTGWNASLEENRYTHEMPGAFLSPGRSGSTGTPLEFWVSSSEEGQLQIAAEVTVQGKVYKSNNTVNPDGTKFNKSIVIIADRSPAYSPDQFNWKPQRVEGAFNGAGLFRYDLGLYPGGRQIKLLDWDTHQYGASSRYPVKFCYTGLILSHPVPRSFTGVMVPVQDKEVDILGFQLAVNRHVGELVAFKGMPPAYQYSGEEARLDPFMFTVVDEFGNAHHLSLVIDIESSEFLLRKG